MQVVYYIKIIGACRSTKLEQRLVYSTIWLILCFYATSLVSGSLIIQNLHKRAAKCRFCKIIIYEWKTHRPVYYCYGGNGYNKSGWTSRFTTGIRITICYPWWKCAFAVPFIGNFRYEMVLVQRYWIVEEKQSWPT